MAHLAGQTLGQSESVCVIMAFTGQIATIVVFYIKGVVFSLWYFSQGEAAADIRFVPIQIIYIIFVLERIAYRFAELF